MSDLKALQKAAKTLQKTATDREAILASFPYAVVTSTGGVDPEATLRLQDYLSAGHSPPREFEGSRVMEMKAALAGPLSEEIYCPWERVPIRASSLSGEWKGLEGQAEKIALAILRRPDLYGEAAFPKASRADLLLALAEEEVPRTFKRTVEAAITGEERLQVQRLLSKPEPKSAPSPSETSPREGGRKETSSAWQRDIAHHAMNCFSVGELRRYLQYADLNDVLRQLPEGSSSPVEFCAALVEACDRQGRLFHLYRIFQNERPARFEETERAFVEVMPLVVRERLCSLLPAQFGELLLRLGVGEGALPGYQSSLSERATALIQLQGWRAVRVGLDRMRLWV